MAFSLSLNAPLLGMGYPLSTTSGFSAAEYAIILFNTFHHPEQML
jgi:hypothetical protein